MAGTVQVGDQLPTEGLLADQFGTSPGTVREALRLLTAEKLLERSGPSGTSRVAALGSQHVSNALRGSLALLTGAEELSLPELMQVRVVLETSAAGLAAERRSPAQLRSLAARVNAKARDPLAMFEMHRAFHELILLAAGNRLLSLVALPVLEVSANRVPRGSLDPSVWLQVRADHVEIYRAVHAGDAEAARSAMARHLDDLECGYAAAAHTPR